MSNPYIGLELVNNSGDVAFVTQYVNYSKVLVEFKESGIGKWVQLGGAKMGNFRTPRVHICMERLMNCGAVATVIDCSSATQAKVLFKKSGSIVLCQISNFLRGSVVDRLHPTVHNVGVLGGLPTKYKGKHIRSFSVWKGMLSRCYGNYKEKLAPSYAGCSVAQEWHFYPNYKEWYDNNYVEGYEVDKDILSLNGLYSESTCCFIPPELNKLLIDSEIHRGKYPRGVYRHKRDGKIIAQCSDPSVGKQVWLGYHDNVTDAFIAYKAYKEFVIKREAVSYYLKGKISRGVYEALLQYTVHCTHIKEEKL